MTETTARTYHTMESLRQMAQTDLRNVNRKELVDINDVEIKKDLSQRERMVDFVSQIKNPYCYLDRGMVVKISFAGAPGPHRLRWNWRCVWHRAKSLPGRRPSPQPSSRTTKRWLHWMRRSSGKNQR